MNKINIVNPITKYFFIWGIIRKSSKKSLDPALLAVSSGDNVSDLTWIMSLYDVYQGEEIG